MWSEQVVVMQEMRVLTMPRWSVVCGKMGEFLLGPGSPPEMTRPLIGDSIGAKIGGVYWLL